MKAFVVASGPFGLPVAEELVRACWGIETLFYDATGPEAVAFEKFQKQVSFAMKPVNGADWAAFWSTLKPPENAMLFLIGCPEPEGALKFSSIYSLQAGLLPAQAGPDALSWAIARGETRTGVTLYRRTGRAYSGELLFQESCAIGADDDLATVEAGVAELAVKIVREFWELSTKAQLRPQGTFAAEKTPEPWREGPIAWAQPSARIRNLVRAVAHPRSGAYTFFEGRKLKVWKAVPSGSKPGKAGQVLSTQPLEVGTGDGRLRLDRVQWHTGPETSGAEFAKTRGIKPGAMFEDRAGAKGKKSVPSR